MKVYIYLFLLCCFSLSVHAQSLYDAQGVVIATKVRHNEINVTGSTFLIEEGRLIRVTNGLRHEDLENNYTRRKQNQIEYIRSEGQLVGYYTPSENRFYHVESNGDKVEQVAFLYQGKVYTIDEKPTFAVDAAFPPEWIGYVLFFFLGY